MRVTLVTFDRLPVSLLGCYGAMWNDTPAFNALAAESLLLDQCYAADDDWLREPDAPLGPTRAAARRWLSGPAAHRWRSVRMDVAGPPSALLPDSAVEEIQFHAVGGGLDGDLEVLAVGHELLSESDADPARPSLVWLMLTGLSLETCAAVAEEERRPAAAEQVQRLDAAWEAFLRRRGESEQERSEGLLVVCGLAGALLGRHPRVAEGMPPLIEEVLHVPAWIRGGDSESRGVRWPGLLTTDDLLAAAADLLASGEAAPGGMSTRLRSAARTEIVTRGGAGVLSRRTADEHALLHWTAAIPPGSNAAPLEECSRLWLFQKPDDVWDWLDVSSQRPAEAEERRHALARRLGCSSAESEANQ